MYVCAYVRTYVRTCPGRASGEQVLFLDSYVCAYIPVQEEHLLARCLACMLSIWRGDALAGQVCLCMHTCPGRASARRMLYMHVEHLPSPGRAAGQSLVGIPGPPKSRCSSWTSSVGEGAAQRYLHPRVQQRLLHPRVQMPPYVCPSCYLQYRGCGVLKGTARCRGGPGSVGRTRGKTAENPARGKAAKSPAR